MILQSPLICKECKQKSCRLPWWTLVEPHERVHKFNGLHSPTHIGVGHHSEETICLISHYFKIYFILLYYNYSNFTVKEKNFKITFCLFIFPHSSWWSNITAIIREMIICLYRPWTVLKYEVRTSTGSNLDMEFWSVLWIKANTLV